MREGEWKSGREMNGVNKNLQQYFNLQDIRIDLFKEKVCIYVYIYTHIHTSIQTYTYAFIYTCIEAYLHACMHTWISLGVQMSRKVRRHRHLANFVSFATYNCRVCPPSLIHRAP